MWMTLYDIKEAKEEIDHPDLDKRHCAVSEIKKIAVISQIKTWHNEEITNERLGFQAML